MTNNNEKGRAFMLVIALVLGVMSGIIAFWGFQSGIVVQSIYVALVLRAMLTVAKKQQYIEHNYASSDYVDNIKEEHKEKVFFDDVQIRELLSNLKDYHNIRAKTAIMALIFTGVRRGELCGLEWEDVDLKAKTMSIEKVMPISSRCGACNGQNKDSKL